MYVRCSSQQVFKIKMWYSSLLHWWNSFPSANLSVPKKHRIETFLRESNQILQGLDLATGRRFSHRWPDVSWGMVDSWLMWLWLRKKNNERSIILVIEVKRRWSETGGWDLPESNVMARPWKMVVLETTYSFWEGLLFRCYVSAREGSHEVFTIKWLWSESDTKW